MVKNMKKFKEIFKDVVLLFLIGCFLGFVLETIWYVIKHKAFINERGMLYGPFKPVYGLGIVVITYLFKLFKTNKSVNIFLIGMILGSLYEYLLSLFQEFVLGTSTWNYSKFSFNLNGRIYLPYCIAWGIFSIIWIKFVYPKIHKFSSKTPFWLSVIIAIGFIIDLSLSGLAVYQYSNRANNIQTTNPVLKIIDKHYNDEFMKKRIPKIKPVIKS